tara:strand:- start:2745 stop:2942 length:198 start_codon:yes stop_codon:yes gene_type:complete
LLRFIYFSALFATAYWLITLVVRKLLSVRNVNVIVESPERSSNIQALEKAWSVGENDVKGESEEA